jgi:hypothetical protein
MTTVRPPLVPMPDAFTVTIGLPPVMHHPGAEPHTGFRLRACDCGHWQAANYGVTLQPNWHWCVVDDVRRFVYWKRS